MLTPRFARLPERSRTIPGRSLPTSCSRTIRCGAGTASESPVTMTTCRSGPSPRSASASGPSWSSGTWKWTMPANWPARPAIRLPAQLAPKR